MIRILPVLICRTVATVGTTSSGAVDVLPEIEAVGMLKPSQLFFGGFKQIFTAQEYPSLWVHIDAAWAGMAFSCPEYREIGYLNSINNFAHSFCTNFHKVC